VNLKKVIKAINSRIEMHIKFDYNLLNEFHNYILKDNFKARKHF
jgi:hypothetical protein